MDIWPVDDFGVREGWRFLTESQKPPTPSELRKAGEAMRPWRTLASWYLWRVAQMPGYARREKDGDSKKNQAPVKAKAKAAGK